MDPDFLDITLVKVLSGLIIGLILGSFTTMLSYRIPRKLSIITPPSQCPHCHTPLSKRDLIPVLSWIKEKGLCRHCHERIGTRYLIIELITTLAVTLAFVVIGFEPALIAALFAIIGFVTLATINVEKHR
ncbi:MAG: prepilin peptidase [Alphaproteobacteria bacterium]|nr:prepilin peptidase [Alphaproteobacteria bacterium]